MIISVSQIERFLDCPRRWFYSTHPEIPRLKTYPMLCGIEVHRHIQWFYRKPKEPRPFFFETLSSATRSWFGIWREKIAECKEAGRLILPNPEDDKKFGNIGAACIRQYWKDNFSLPRPLVVEKSFSIKLNPHLVLVGRVDQTRGVSTDYIRQHRPELIVNGQLHPDFDPVVIIDLKSGYMDFDVRAFKEDPLLEEQVRRQFELHENLQLTLYTWVYWRKHGRLPIGVWWYHLRSGKVFFSFREEEDFQNLFGVLNHFIENVAAQSFPKHIGRQCETCEHLLPCRENRHFVVVQPEALDEEMFAVPKVVPTEVAKEEATQPKLKRLKVPRKMQKTPKVAVPSQIVLHNLPWDEEDQIEKTLES